MVSATEFLEVEQHALYQITNAPILAYPYPHIYVENVFPSWFYEELLKHLPNLEVYQPIKKTGNVAGKSGNYDDRYVIHLRDEALDQFDANSLEFWRDVMLWLQGENTIRFLLGKFDPFLKERFRDTLQNILFHPYTQLVRDFTNHSITPHTDAAWKVAVFLFYLPSSADHIQLGTSLYVPNDPTLRCPGDIHHPREQFTKVITAEYKPNTMLGFFKSSISFHGVEPVTVPDVQRDLIQYSICFGNK